MSYSNSDIQALYDRVVRMARSYGLDPRWELVRGQERTADRSRQPWVVKEGDLVLFTLGFTRRNAYDALMVISSVFEYLVTTEDWTEDEQ